jgi:hypothetical protein
MNNNKTRTYALTIAVIVAILMLVPHLQARFHWIQERTKLLGMLQTLSVQSNNQTKKLLPVSGKEQPGTNALSLTANRVLSDLLSLPATESETDPVFGMHIVLHRLGLLVHCGEDGFPAIREFLGNGMDRNYPLFHTSAETNASISTQDSTDNFLGYVFAQHSRSRYDFVFPPTLRLGVMETLEAIVGKGAESVLANVIDQSRRGIEVYFAYRSLERMAPGRYRTSAISVAKELTSLNPPPWPQGGRFGARNECQDPSLGSFAQKWLIDDQGHVNRNAIEYCVKTFKANAVPLLQSAYNNPNLGDVRERMHLAGLASDYCGVTKTANDFIASVINDKDILDILRMMMVQTLGGYNMFTKTYVDINPQTVASRVETASVMIADQRTEPFVKDGLQRTLSMLQKKAEVNSDHT